MTELIPREILFGDQERARPSLSPDGSRLGWIAPKDGVLNVWVAPISSEGVSWDHAVAVTDDTDQGIRRFGWARDGRHLLYLQDSGGDENWRMYDVDLETMARRDHTPFPKIQAQLIASRKSRPDELLVGMNLDNPELHDVYRLTLSTGELVKEIENPGFAAWLADEDMRVRAALAPQPDGGFNLLVKDKDRDADWRVLLTIEADDVPSFDALSFSQDGRSLLLRSAAGSDTGRLVRVDIATGASTVLLADPEADVADAMLHPDTREPQIVELVKARVEFHVLDPSVQADFDEVRKLDAGDPQFIGRDDADQTWLISFNNDDQPAKYYRYDRGTRTGRFLFTTRPELERYTLAKAEPFSFTTRDGLTVYGYATFPPGEPRENLPAVINVHGGPQERDVWEWYPGAQWLANRGYLCVQVNYRGSTGYGKAFVAAGDREWGAKMHDDLLDAVGYITAQGWADKNRIGIYGASYGGYAALVGAAFTPDMFACAVDISGPSNLKTLLDSIPAYWGPAKAQLFRRIGNPETEEEFLWSRSPLSRVGDIRIPVLIAQGTNDPRVKPAESEQIVAALKAAGIDHEYLLFPDEGHGFYMPENRLRFFGTAEKFLARHLGGRAEG